MKLLCAQAKAKILVRHNNQSYIYLFISILELFFISYSTTGRISGMEYNATAFVGCDNQVVSTVVIPLFNLLLMFVRQLLCLKVKLKIIPNTNANTNRLTLTSIPNPEKRFPQAV